MSDQTKETRSIHIGLFYRPFTLVDRINKATDRMAASGWELASSKQSFGRIKLTFQRPKQHHADISILKLSPVQTA